MSAVYTPLLGMPANSTVTITAYLTNLPGVDDVLHDHAGQSGADGHLCGADPVAHRRNADRNARRLGLCAGTMVTLSGTSSPISYIDYNDATVQVPVAVNATGSLNLQVANPTPGGGTGNSFTESVAPNSITLTAVTRTGPTPGRWSWGSTSTCRRR